MLTRGELIDERFKVLAKLGEGGLGEVYLARDNQLGRRVAIKTIKPPKDQNDSEGDKNISCLYRDTLSTATP